MAIWVLAIFWIALGLGVFLVAFRGGGRRRAPGGARGDSRGTRGSRRATAMVAGAIMILFGIALPAVVLATGGDKQEKQAPGGVDLTTAQVHGRQLFAQNCATCHTLHAVNAVGKVGPNLDQLRPPAPLIVNAIEQGRARGGGQMPANLVSGTDARAVADFVAAVAGH
jgi:mono/diheme cytochrome c family protein